MALGPELGVVAQWLAEPHTQVHSVLSHAQLHVHTRPHTHTPTHTRPLSPPHDYVILRPAEPQPLAPGLAANSLSRPQLMAEQTILQAVNGHGVEGRQQWGDCKMNSAEGKATFLVSLPVGGKGGAGRR